MKSKPSVGRAEMEILRFIADHPGSSVGEVGEFLSKEKGQTRNTALNVMERLRRKGFLEREKVEGVFRYQPVLSRSMLFDQLVDDFVEYTLGGSCAPILAYLTERIELTDEQFAELRAMVKQLEDKRG